MIDPTQAKEVIHGVSHIVRSIQVQVSQEQACPKHNADFSDEVIRDGQERVTKLRLIRDQLEDIFTGYLP